MIFTFSFNLFLILAFVLFITDNFDISKARLNLASSLLLFVVFALILAKMAFTKLFDYILPSDFGAFSSFLVIASGPFVY